MILSESGYFPHPFIATMLFILLIHVFYTQTYGSSYGPYCQRRVKCSHRDAQKFLSILPVTEETLKLGCPAKIPVMHTIHVGLFYHQ